MSNPLASPSMDPSSIGDLTGTMRLMLTKFLQGTDDMLPAQVIAYDRTTNLARVQPLIYIVDTNKNNIERAQIASIPVLQLGGGGFVLSFPLVAGNLGWIKANDRDISLFKQFHEVSPPNTSRKHSFSDAVFIPDTMFQSVTINEEDTENVVLQNLAGTVRVAIWSDKVKVTAPEVDIVAPIISMTATTSVTITSPITTITGELAAGTASGGDATFGGTITATGEVTGAGIPLSVHKHTGVQTGSGDTGEPIV